MEKSFALVSVLYHIAGNFFRLEEIPVHAVKLAMFLKREIFAKTFHVDGFANTQSDLESSHSYAVMCYLGVEFIATAYIGFAHISRRERRPGNGWKGHCTYKYSIYSFGWFG